MLIAALAAPRATLWQHNLSREEQCNATKVAGILHVIVLLDPSVLHVVLDYMHARN